MGGVGSGLKGQGRHNGRRIGKDFRGVTGTQLPENVPSVVTASLGAVWPPDNQERQVAKLAVPKLEPESQELLNSDPLA